MDAELAKIRFNEELVNFKLRLIDGMECKKVSRKGGKQRDINLILPPPYICLRWDVSEKKQVRIKDIANAVPGSDAFDKAAKGVPHAQALTIEINEESDARPLHLIMKSVQERDEFVQGLRLFLEDVAGGAAFDSHGCLKRSVAFGEIEHPLVRLVAESQNFVD